MNNFNWDKYYKILELASDSVLQYPDNFSENFTSAECMGLYAAVVVAYNMGRDEVIKELTN